MTTSTFDIRAERVDLTLEGLQYYAAKLTELTTSLEQTANGKHPQDVLPLLMQIDEVLDCMKRRTSKHITPERAEAFWGRVAKAKAREM